MPAFQGFAATGKTCTPTSSSRAASAQTCSAISSASGLTSAITTENRVNVIHKKKAKRLNRKRPNW
jgi:hypothetical protein